MSDGTKKLSFKSLSWLMTINIVGAVVGVIQTITIAVIFWGTRAVEMVFAASTMSEKRRRTNI